MRKPTISDDIRPRHATAESFERSAGGDDLHAADPDRAVIDADAPRNGGALKAETLASAIKALRRATGLTQEEFCVRFGIPLGTLRDWEQGRSEPDKPAKAYLQAIAGDSTAVSRALETGRVSCSS
jgi:putative transcriptional regulator